MQKGRASSTSFFYSIRRKGSEGITHAEVERRILPLEVVDPPLARGIVRVVQLDTPVEAQHGELDVEAQAQTGIESQLVVETVETEDRGIGILRGILADVPDVAQVEERRAVDDAPDREAQLEVRLELHVARLHGKRTVRVEHRALAEGSGRPAAHAVAAAAVELPVERYRGGVAVGHRHTAVEVPYERRLLTLHDLPADAQVRTEILRIGYSEDRIVSVCTGGREEEVLDPVDQVARGLQIEADARGVAVGIPALVVVAVSERQAADELRVETLKQVAVRRELLALRIGVVHHEERDVEIRHVDHVDVHGAQREGGVAVVGPQVGDAGTRQRAAVVGTVLEVDRQLDLRAGLVHRFETSGTPRQQEAREGQRGGNAEFRGTLLLGVGSLHELITRREGDVEGLGTPEDIAVLIAHRGLQSVETRGCAPFEIDLETLPQGRRAEDVAGQGSLAEGRQRQRIGRRIRRGGLPRGGRLLLEGDPRTLEIPQRHQFGVGAAHLRGVVDAARIERNGLPQHRGADIGPAVVDDVQAPVGERVEPPEQRRVLAQGRGIEVREEVDPVDAVDRIVIHAGAALLVIPRQIAPHDHAQLHPPVARKRVGPEDDLIDRKVVVSAVAEVGRDAFALVVEHRHVEDIPPVQQRSGRIGKNQPRKGAVAKHVGHRIDAVGLALEGAEGYLRPPAPRDGVHLAYGPRRKEALRVHVDLEIAYAPRRERRVEEHGSLADTAFPVVPAVLLRGVRLPVEPDVEVGAQQPLVGGLPDIFPEFRGGDPLLAGHRTVLLDTDLLQVVASLGQLPRNAAGRAGKAQHDGCNDTTDLPHGIQRFQLLLKKPFSLSSAK